VTIRHVLYAHGFASSPQSTKAIMLAERLKPFGIVLRAPDFNQPEFSTLTVTRMLGQVHDELAALPPGPVAIVGSSLGGFVAVHAAARQDPAPSARIAGLILLAPAFEFGSNRMRDLGPAAVEQWKAAGRMEFFHYAYGEPRSVGYALYEDARRYDPFALPDAVPTVIVYGTRDQSVDPRSIERWAEGRSQVTLRPVDDGHQLAGSLEVIWRETANALGLKARP
jgi:uncharacterized protein